MQLRKRIVSLFSLALCLAVLFTAVPAGAEMEFDIESITKNHILLMDSETGSVLYEKGGRQRAYPASTTKIMTCILTLEKCKDLNEVVTIGAVTSRGSVMGIKEGEHIKLKDLLYGLMLFSGNDAAEAIANHVAGSKDAFVNMMNEKARKLGMTETHFVNPNGLHDEKHYSSAYDLAILSRYAMQNETFRGIVSTGTYTSEATDKNPDGYELFNSNRLVHKVKEEEKDYTYRYITGIKTGNTIEAGYCIVASAKKNDRELILVLLGDPEGQVASTYRYESAKRIFEWGFANCSSVSASSLNLKSSFEIMVNNASFEDEFSGKLELVANIENRVITGMKPFIEEVAENAASITYVTDYNAVTAPVSSGSVIGTVTYKYKDNDLLTVDLVASRDIANMDDAANPLIVEPAPKTDSPINYLLIWILAAVLIIIIVIVFKLLTRRSAQKRRNRRRGRYIYKRR